MKKATLILCLLLAVSPLAWAQQAQQETMKKELLQRIQQLWQAWKDHNVQPFREHLAPEGITVSPSGIETTAEMIANIEKKRCTVNSFSIDQNSARLTKIGNNTYIINYRAEQDATCDGKKAPSPVMASEVWSKQQGKWKGFFYQESPLQP